MSDDGTPRFARRTVVKLLAALAASPALVATLAVEIAWKALESAGIGPPGRFLLVTFRIVSSLQPPQPGSRPTPTSTRPI